MTFLANYYTSAEKNEHFMKFVVEKVKELANQGRSVLLVVNRLSTTDYIEQEIPEAKILTSKRKDEITESDNIVVATYNIASKGLDIPHIDTLVSLSLVRGNVSFVQLIGRILRQKEGKKNPLALFIYDKTVKEHPEMYFIDEDIKNQINRILE
jgi:superfamily II DNA or RNA helicase